MAIYFYNKNNKLKTHKFKIKDEVDLYKPLRSQYELNKLNGIIEPNPHIDFNPKIEKRNYYNYTGSMIKRRITKGNIFYNKRITGRITKQEIRDITKKHNEKAKKIIDANGRFNEVLKNMNSLQEIYLLDYEKIRERELIKYDLSRQARASILTQWKDELYNKNNRDIIADLFLKSINKIINYRKIESPYFKDYLITFENTLINYILYNYNYENQKKYYWRYNELLFIVSEVKKGKIVKYKLEIFNSLNVKKSLRELMKNYNNRYKELLDKYIN